MHSACMTAERQSVRYEVNRLVYVELPSERAFMLNVSDRGMAIQTMNVLEPGSSFDFAILLPDQDLVHSSGRIVWSDKSGRAGVQFFNTLDVSPFWELTH